MSDDPPIDPEPDVPDPAPEEPAEPVPAPVSTFIDRPMPFDAPLDVRAQYFQGSRLATVGAAVRRPGQAETSATGGRAPVSGAHNWVPIGPRNVGGRVRCIAIDPTDVRVMYAGPASGGIYKTRDAGETWFPLWHDEPSLSMGAIAISPSQHDTIWAGTGESATGGGETIPPSGVWRSTDAGANWVSSAAVQAVFDQSKVAALAPHPTDPKVCWAATDTGIYRTLNGTDWAKFADGQSYSDVAIIPVGANLWVFLAMSGFQTRPGPPITQHPVIVRIQNPSIADVALHAILPDFAPPAPANTFLLRPAPAGPFHQSDQPIVLSTRSPADGKLAAFPRSGGVGPFLYAAWAREGGTLYRVYRLANLDAVTGAGNPNLTVGLLANHPNFRHEEQGAYNLAIAVNPRNAAQIAFGMQEMYINRSATANPSQVNHWQKAQDQFLYVVDRGHHADHHQFVIAPRPPPPSDQGVGAGADWLWDANDGGISVSGDWQAAVGQYPNDQGTFPLPAGVPTWRKRSHGISASQMYDLTQHPRLPSVMGCGFQDNGAFVSTGGMSWQLIQTADGGFVAFDPDDPYRLLATWQQGITEARFAGRLRDSMLLLGEAVQVGTWPRELTDGFHGSDRAPFVTETVFHPTRPGRVFAGRRNRLYATRTTTGDRWLPEPAGCGVEFIHEPTAAGAAAGSIEVLHTPAAVAIGLLAQRNETRQAEDRFLGARVRTLLAEPFEIQNGQSLQFVVHNDAGGAPAPVNIILNTGPNLPAQASAAQLATYVTARAGGLLTALPVIWPASGVVTLFTREAGRVNTIGLDGDAMGQFMEARRISAGSDAGALGGALPAVAFLGVFDEVDLSGKFLLVTRNGVAQRRIDFPAGSVLGVQQLAARLRGALLADRILVATNDISWGVRLTATNAGGQADITETGGTIFRTKQPLPPARSFSINAQRSFAFPAPPPLQVRLRDATTTRHTADLAMTTVGLVTADVTDVSSVELVHAFRAELARAPANTPVRCDLDLNPSHENDWTHSSEGVMTEVAFSPINPNIAWAGDDAGRMYRSTDGGDTWPQVTPLPTLDRSGKVDAIAPHPTEPATVFVGVYVEGSRPATFPGFLYRSIDNGATWNHVGADIVDAVHDLVGVRAVEIDPNNSDHVFAATDVGVWFSDNGGTRYRPLNQGLPNARVTDLAFEPHQRLLRAGVWGRGVYERHVGDEHANDVRLHLRTTLLDDSWSQPVPGPDVAALVPTSLVLDQSPDIKHTLSDPRRGVVLDGVEFDEDVRDEEIRKGDAFIAVQVNNRGAFSTSTARVALLWAPADAGPPELPPALWNAVTGVAPLVAAATFGEWTVIGDQTLPDDGVDHNVVAPGYPRVAVFGSAAVPIRWPDDVEKHRRVGLLALCRSTEDALARGPDNVFDLVHAEAKAAYRECDVVLAVNDDRIVLRATTASGFTIAALTGGGRTNAANGAAPFGLSAVAAAAPVAEFATAGAYNLAGTTWAFRMRATHNVTVSFTANDPAFRNQAQAFGDEVAVVLNRSLIEAGIPVRATGRTYTTGVTDAVRITPIAQARVTISPASTAAARLGLTTGVERTATAHQVFETAFANRARAASPWDLRPPVAGPLTLVMTIVVEADMQFPPSTPEIPVPATATARQVRAAMNHQFRAFGLPVVAERRRTGLAVRRSPTEAAASRVVTGGFGLGDLVVVPGAEVAAGVARDALFDVLTTFGPDVLVRSATNRLYLRSANTGNVDIAQVRHRLFHVTLSPFGVANVGSTVNEARNAGASGVASLTWDVPALAAGSRAFVLAIADTVADPLDPTAAGVITTIEQAHDFCLKNSNAALREFVVA